MTISGLLLATGPGTTTSGDTWSSSFGSGPTAGEAVLVALTTDNIATTDGASSTHTGFSGGGLTWTKLAEVTASSGAAADGVTISLWQSSVAESTSGSLSFTATFSAAVSAKVATQCRFTADSLLSADALDIRTNYATAQYGSMSTGTLASAERLYLRVSAGEYGASTNATRTDASWTLGSGTNIGSGASGVMGRHEGKIATSTGETSAFTQNIAIDSASIFVALSEGGGSSTPVSFSGTIPTQNATEGTAFSVDLSSYFSGTETPFAYSVQSGTLPTGLTLNSSTGEITGTPTTAGTASGIVIRATDAGSDTADSNSFSIDVAAADTTAPVLTSPTGTATGQTTASGTVSTDEANGTLYYLATTNSTESAATVKGGSSQAVTATGEQSVSVTGLTAGTGYYLHYVHRDAAGNDSTVASSSLFTTDAALVTTLKVLCDARAAGATSVHGAVFAAPATGDLLGAFIGEFIGAEFEADLESGEAVLLVPVSDFGGEALTTSDTAVVVFEAVSSASSALGNAVPFGSAGVHEATIVEA